MKRICSLLIILFVCFTVVLPATAYAADTETAIGTSGSETTPTGKDAAVTENDGGTKSGDITDRDIFLPEDTPDDSDGKPQGGTPDGTAAEHQENLPGGDLEETDGASDFRDFPGEAGEFFFRVRLTVTDRQGNPLSGVVYGLYDMNGQVVEHLATGDSGVAESGDVAAGTDYYLEEITPPSGFAPNAERREIIAAGSCVPPHVEVIVEYSPFLGRIKVMKTGENEELLSGVVFDVCRASDGERIAGITTDGSGEAEIELPLGAYYLVETQAAAGYTLPESGFPFALTEHGTTVKLSILNQREPEPEDGAVRLVTLDENTQEPIPGVTLGVYDAESGEKLAELITGADGAAELALPAGSFYLLELAVPEGYALNSDKTGFAIAAGETTEVTVTNTRVPIEPEPPTTGFIKVTKKAEGTDTLLSGAVFGVYEAGTDIRAAEIVTGADGTATTGELPAGSFYLLERKAPSGFDLNTEKIGVTVRAGETAEVTVYNAAQGSDGDDTGRLRLIKEAEDTGERLSGAVFGVYQASNNSKVAEITTDNNGVAIYELDAGRFYLRELEAPEGFALESGEISFTITAGATKTVTVTNTPEDIDTGHVRFTKKDEDTGEPLSGAVLGVYRASDDRKVTEITTNSNGTATYELEAGRYYLLELEAPPSYMLKTDKIGFTVKAGETTAVTVLNARKDSGATVTGNLYLVKKAEGTGAKLPGAVFGVYRALDNAKIDEITTDSEGVAVCELEPNDYYLRELKAPTGFLPEPARIPFTVKADAAVRVEVTNMRDQGAGSVRLIKRGPDGEAVSGAVFGVYRASDNAKVAGITSGNDGTAVCELAPGAYYLLEKSVPSAYALNTEKHSFTVSSDRTVEVLVVNQRAASAPSGGIEIPKTGEPFPTMNYLLSALFFSTAATCGWMLYRERGRRPKKA